MNAAPDWINSSQLPAIAADAQRLALELRHGANIPTVNYCGHRYHFWVALFASLLAERRALLPPSAERQATNRILPGQDKQRLDDNRVAAFCRYRESADAAGLIARAQAASSFVTVFTSGSTGTPKAIEKSWSQLADRAASYVNTVFAEQSHIVAMVPQQHMYGLEASLFTSLLNGFRVRAHDSAFPAATATAVTSSDQPPVLVTTPNMLQLLLKADTDLGPLAGIVSATSPLGADLKQRAEQRFGCNITEIYGFSEAGSVAWRREGEPWQLLPGLTAEQNGDAVDICNDSGVVATVEDHVERINSQQILLKGRPADLVKVGGKRASLAGMTQQLMQLNQVRDGHVALCSETGRLEAFVVANDSNSREIRRAMAAVCDMSFVPRKVHIVSEIPRSAAGKVTAQGLAAMRNKVDK